MMDTKEKQAVRPNTRRRRWGTIYKYVKEKSNATISRALKKK